MAEKKVKKKINLKGILIVILAIYLVVMVGYYFFTIPIKGITINGNNVLSDKEIIATAELGEYPSLLKINNKSVKEKIKSLDIIKDVKVKKKITGEYIINVEEESILYYNKQTEKYVLSSDEEISLEKKVLGVPILINYTPSDISKELNKKLVKIEKDIISLISEIEYNPDVKEDVTIDENRFVFHMNDGNKVYINVANMDKLAMYKNLYSTVEQKGTFYLDGNRKTVLFRTFEAEKNNIEEGDTIELPE